MEEVVSRSSKRLRKVESSYGLAHTERGRSIDWLRLITCVSATVVITTSTTTVYPSAQATIIIIVIKV